VYTFSPTIHRPCTRPCTRYAHGRKRLCTRPEHTVWTGCVRLRLSTCSCTRAVYTIRTRPCTRATQLVETAVTRSCMRRVHVRKRPRTWPVHGRVPGRITAAYMYIRVHGPYRRPLHGYLCAMYTSENGRLHGPCTRPVYGRVYGRVHLYTCTWAVETAVTRTGIYVYMARTRPCTRHVHGRVHGPFTAVYTATVYTAVYIIYVYMGRRDGIYTAEYVPCTRPIDGPCTRPYSGRVRVYTCRVYRWPCARRVHGRLRSPYRAVYTGRVHGGTRPCTRSCTRPVSGPFTVM